MEGGRERTHVPGFLLSREQVPGEARVLTLCLVFCRLLRRIFLISSSLSLDRAGRIRSTGKVLGWMFLQEEEAASLSTRHHGSEGRGFSHGARSHLCKIPACRLCWAGQYSLHGDCRDC